MACFFCPNESTSKCEECPQGYCSEDHFKLHKSSDGTCQPFKLQVKEGVGRILVATRDILPFETVLQDKCVGWGPFIDVKVICVACLTDKLDIHVDK